MKSLREAASRCRDAWLGGAKLWIVVYKYKRGSEGIVKVSENKIPIAFYRDLEDREIHWLYQSFGSIRTDKTNKEIIIKLKIYNGAKKWMVDVPVLPPSASGTWHIGISQESPGYLQMHIDDGKRIVSSGRISIHKAGITPASGR